TLNGCQFINSSAIGGAGPYNNSGQGKGGAVFILAGATAIAGGTTYTNNTAAGAGQNSVGAAYGFAPYVSNTTCPGQDTADVCGILTPGVQVTIGTNINGPLISVDGGPGFTGSQVVTWVANSSHTVAASTPQTSGGTRYVWLNWSDNGAVSHNVTGPSTA